MLVSLLTLSCSKQLHFSGVSENNVNLLKEDYLNKKYTKGDVIKFIGEPNIKEKSDNLWIYRLTKSKGNSTFKKTIYNKTLKLEFSDNILRSVEEVNLN
tara:strand:+ start:675 stop:971 length:297 start_codon:yes stop_codon:yes gene_type:complete